MNTCFEELLDRFAVLGGIAENVCQKEGECGRGVFPIDPSRRVKIMTPKKLLISHDNIGIHDGEIIIKDKTVYSEEVCIFLETYYNEYAWGNNGNSDSADFLKFVESSSELIKTRLLDCGFVDKNFMDVCFNEEQLLKRFIDERTVAFRGCSVLAPVWELVNHSSFAPPLRITPYGLETPPLEAASGEILFKYSGKNSSMSMWKKYGFACKCIVAYSIPFRISMNNDSLCISCSGQLGLGPNENKGISIVADSISIKSLPIGCLSAGLPFVTFKSILCSSGLSLDLAKRLFLKVRELNLSARRDLLNSLQETGFGGHAELYRALTYEIDLIESSSI